MSQEPTKPGQSQRPEPDPDDAAQAASSDPTRPSASRFRLPPVAPKVNLDTGGMPLPRRVPERDPEGTRVVRPNVLSQPWDPDEAARTVPNAPHVTLTSYPLPRTRWRALGRLTLNVLTLLFVLFAVVTTAMAVFITYEYVRIAQTLPPPTDLDERAASFQSTYIYDSSGQLLYELNDPNKGRRTRIPLSQISPYLIAATIATEDADYYNHPGFDVVALLKAVYRAYRYDSELAGASTITQQLTRALYLRLSDCDNPDAETSCYERSVERKVREIILAAEINRNYSKDEILELYLNEIYYGNLAYGIEAAARTYFNKDAKDLTLGEATFLAGLPQSPAIYDIYTNYDVTLNRHKQVIVNMVEKSGTCSPANPKTGIEVRVGDQVQHVCVTQADAAAAVLEISDLGRYPFTPPVIDAKYPHWVNYIRQILEQQFGQELYRSGYRVYTTLHPALQDLALAEVKTQVDSLAGSNVTNGALVALDPRTGQILAMVGSDNYDDEVDGQINMAIRPRQPGSSIKPLTYVAAFEKGWTPATLIWDVPTEFPDGANPPYVPPNYDGRFHGPVRLRDALANSYNIPAVRALQFVGVYDDPNTPQRDGLVGFAERLGITSLTRSDYGLALTLGGGDVSLMEMTTAYAIFANGGKKIIPVAIARIENSSGTVVCEQPLEVGGTPAVPVCQATPGDLGQQVVRPEHAFLISDIMADNHARSLAFGPNSALRLSYAAAVKTGTTNDYRDNWTVGYVPNLAVGVWVGNADFTPMAAGVSGVTGAGPIWHNVMEKTWTALGRQPEPFVQPPGVVVASICALTGAAENDYCRPIPDPRRPNEPPVIQERFAADQLPLGADKDVVAQLFIDKFSGLRASPECNNDSSNTELKTFVTVTDPFALRWLEQDEQGRRWAEILHIQFPVTAPPVDTCRPDGTRPIIALVSPAHGQVLDGVVDIVGVADVTNDQFDHYIVDWGISHDPGGWATVSGDVRTPVKDSGLLARWDTKDVPNGEATIRIMVFDKRGNVRDERVHVFVQHPVTNTPVPTDTAVPPTPTATFTNVPTLPPTETSVPPTATTAPTQAPSETPVPPTATTAPPTDTAVPASPSETPTTP